MKNACMHKLFLTGALDSILSLSVAANSKLHRTRRSERRGSGGTAALPWVTAAPAMSLAGQLEQLGSGEELDLAALAADAANSR